MPRGRSYFRDSSLLRQIVLSSGCPWRIPTLPVLAAQVQACERSDRRSCSCRTTSKSGHDAELLHVCGVVPEEHFLRDTSIFPVRHGRHGDFQFLACRLNHLIPDLHRLAEGAFHDANCGSSFARNQCLRRRSLVGSRRGPLVRAEADWMRRRAKRWAVTQEQRACIRIGTTRTEIGDDGAACRGRQRQRIRAPIFTTNA